jgi:BMFP domain-containing protein YqiC
MSHDAALDAANTLAYVMHRLYGDSVVQRQDYDQALQMLANVYRENNLLRQRLAALEQLASSWSGSPQNHAAIRDAREELQKGLGRIWLPRER